MVICGSTAGMPKLEHFVIELTTGYRAQPYTPYITHTCAHIPPTEVPKYITPQHITDTGKGGTLPGTDPICSLQPAVIIPPLELRSWIFTKGGGTDGIRDTDGLGSTNFIIAPLLEIGMWTVPKGGHPRHRGNAALLPDISAAATPAPRHGMTAGSTDTGALENQGPE